MTMEFFQHSIRKLDAHRILMKIYQVVQYSDQKIRWQQNSYEFLKRMTNIPIRKLDNHGTFMKFLKFTGKVHEYSDQKIRWPRNSYEILIVQPLFLIRKLDDHRILVKFLKDDQYSDQKIRWPWNSYVILDFDQNSGGQP